jgi:hypothetical protein
MPIDVLALELETKPASRAHRATPALRHMGGLLRPAVPDRQAVQKGQCRVRVSRTDDAQT